MDILDKILEWIEENKEDAEFSDCSYDLIIYYEEIVKFLNDLKLVEQQKNSVENIKQKIIDS